jgi:hypothetical protein
MLIATLNTAFTRASYHPEDIKKGIAQVEEDACAAQR